MNIKEAMVELSKPFHPSEIEWKPQATSRDGGKAMAIAYADPRAYMNRLDAVVGGEWSVTYTPWGDRIVCHLTVCGVTRSSTGEGDSQSERSEIAGTAAEGQAFKRACVMFGLGRYLYNLPSSWVEYDKENKTFSAQGKAKLEQLITQHYKRATQEQAPAQRQAPASQPPAVAQQAEHRNIEDVNHLLDVVEEVAGEEQGEQEPAKKLGMITQAQSNTLHALGMAFYGTQEKWNAMRPGIVLGATQQRSKSSSDLTQSEAVQLIAIIENRIRKAYETDAKKLFDVEIAIPDIELGAVYGVELATAYGTLRKLITRTAKAAA